jgi:hypothetical protein
MQQSADFYQKTDVRPPFTYASLIRQVKVLLTQVMAWERYGDIPFNMCPPPPPFRGLDIRWKRRGFHLKFS